MKTIYLHAVLLTLFCVASVANAASYKGNYTGSILLKSTKPATCPANVASSPVSFRITQKGNSIILKHSDGTTLRGGVFSYGIKAKGKRDASTTDTMRLTNVTNTSASANLKVLWTGTGIKCTYLYKGTLTRSK